MPSPNSENQSSTSPVGCEVKTPELERLVVEHFNYRRNLIVPNVFWGWGLNYEADLVVVTQAGYAAEVELKVSKSDLRADAKKRHSHDAAVFKRLWFAMPEDIFEESLVPDRAGVLLAREQTAKRRYGRQAKKISPVGWELRVHRKPTDTKAKAIDDVRRLKLAKLGCMRVWKLKERACSKGEK